MESFGLFNLLKSMLSFEQKEEEKPQEKEVETPSPATQETQKATEENAYLRFVEAHEQRKKKR